MAGSGNEENLSEGKELLPVQFGQVGPDLDRVIVVPRQRDGLKLRLFILAGLFQDTGQTIMQRYQSAHAEWLSFLLLCNPFFKLNRHPLEVVIGRIIGIGCSHRHSGSGERPFVRYPLYPARAGGFWITTLERHAAKLCYFCTLCQLGAFGGRRVALNPRRARPPIKRKAIGAMRTPPVSLLKAPASHNNP